MEIKLGVGRVHGAEARGVSTYTGMPYAHARRFELARPASWDGAFDATGYGPDAPQNPGEHFKRPHVREAEDCLRVNVWTPDPSGKRPVMFWIHGGGYMQGSASLLSYEGADLARRGDVVVVSVNYRLGALGFAAHPELARQDGTSGNWGLYDQIEALRWVQREIARFGGDPDEVTIFGESAGGGSVLLLMSSPLTRGLFKRAICQSGPPTAVSKQFVRDAVEKLASELETSVRGLAEVPLDALLRAQRTVEAGVGGMAFLPVVDGTLLERSVLETFETGRAAQVPLLMGTTADEYRLFASMDRHSRDLDDKRLRDRVGSLVMGGVDEILDTYRRERAARGLGVENNDLWYALKTDEFFLTRTRAVIERHSKYQPVYQYLFTYGSPAMGGWMGAAHGLEIPFIFGTYALPEIADFCGGGPRADVMNDRMLRSWVAFARTGNPSTPDLEWPTFHRETRPVMRLDVESQVLHAPAEREVSVLEKYLKA